MHHPCACLLSSRPRVQPLAANTALCLLVRLWTETSSQILLSTSEAKVAALRGSCSRFSPDLCGKVYHPVNNKQLKNLIHIQHPDTVAVSFNKRYQR